MYNLSCKVCGGAIEVDSGEVIFCPSCGTRIVAPKVDTNRRADMFDRTNSFRNKKEFVRAMGIAEQLVKEEPDDPEGYWALLLCKYGIVYEKGDGAKEYVPFSYIPIQVSIFDDADYNKAISCANGEQREIYESAASDIAQVLHTDRPSSAKQEVASRPATANFDPAMAGVAAQQIPMAPANFEPAPTQASSQTVASEAVAQTQVLSQTQSMAPIREENLAKAEPMESTPAPTPTPMAVETQQQISAEPAKREQADREPVQAVTPEQAQAVAPIPIATAAPIDTPAQAESIAQEVSQPSEVIEAAKEKKKTVFFVDENANKEIDFDGVFTEESAFQDLEEIYSKACRMMEEARYDTDFKQLAGIFGNIRGYKNSSELQRECLEKIETSHLDTLYNLAKGYHQNGSQDNLEKAMALYRQISGWKDADEQAELCRQELEISGGKEDLGPISSSDDIRVVAKKLANMFKKK